MKKYYDINPVFCKRRRGKVGKVEFIRRGIEATFKGKYEDLINFPFQGDEELIKIVFTDFESEILPSEEQSENVFKKIIDKCPRIKFIETSGWGESSMGYSWCKFPKKKWTG